MAGFDNDVVYANNVDFSGGSPVTGKVTTDGQMLIGSTASPNIKVGTIANGNNLTWTFGSGSATANLTGTTDHAVQLGNASGSLSSLGLGSAGQVLTSNGAGLDPSFQGVSASGAITTITGNDLVAESPTAGNFNIVGSGSITTVGSVSTETVQLTGLTANNVLVGAGTATITKVAPSSTSGIPLVSNGAASDPSFTTAVVAGGGTGRTSLTNHGVLIGQGTSAINQTAAGSAGQVLQSGGASADPTYSTATFPSTSGTTGTILRSNGTNWVNTTATYPTTTTANRILFSSATNTISEITSAANSILSTDGSSIPSFGTSLNSNYTFTSSTAATNRQLTVSHTDNTSASSEAIYHVSTGGTSSGDAYLRCAIGTARSYAVGIDNSDSQTFKINTAVSSSVGPSTGSTIFSGTSDGYIRHPLTACASAYRAATAADVTGDGTAYLVIFDAESFDQNNNFDTATGLFTAPVTGKYLITANVGLAGLTSSHTAGNIYITAGGSIIRNFYNPAAMRDASDQMTMSISAICTMLATNTASITVVVSGGTKVVDILDENFGTFANVNVALIA